MGGWQPRASDPAAPLQSVCLWPLEAPVGTYLGRVP